MLAAPVSAPVLPSAHAAATPAPEAEAPEQPFARVLDREAQRRATPSRPAPATRGPTHDGGSGTEATEDTGRKAPAEGRPTEAAGESAEAGAPAEDRHPTTDTAADAWAALLTPPPARPSPVETPRAAATGLEAAGAAAQRARGVTAGVRDAAVSPGTAAGAAPAAMPETAETRAGGDEPRFALPAAATTARQPPAPEGPIAAPAAPAPAASAAPVAEASVAAHPASPAFASELGTRLTTFVRDGVEHARLELHPVELGPVTVQIQLDGAQAQVHLMAEQAPTRQALEQALPALAGSLRDAGLTLSGGGVFEHPRQPAQDGSSGTGTPAGRRGSGRGDDGPPAVAAAPAALRRRGVVDLVA